jgi:hypothetical protein
MSEFEERPEQSAQHEGIARRARAWGEEVVTPRAEWAEKVLAQLESLPRSSRSSRSPHSPLSETAEPVSTIREMDRVRTGKAKRNRFAEHLPALRFAAAAILLVGFGVGGLVVRTQTRSAPSSTEGGLLPADALAEVRSAEKSHAEAISRLEATALPILAAATDPAVSPRDAALLVGYRNRLRSVDRSIEGMRTYLESNPYHARVRAALLKSYGEKSELLREIVAMRRGA